MIPRLISCLLNIYPKEIKEHIKNFGVFQNNKAYMILDAIFIIL